MELHLPNLPRAYSPHRPFDDVWEKFIQRVLYKEDLAQEPQRYDRAFIAPHGGLSTLTANGGRGGDVRCLSPILTTARKFVVEAYGSAPHPNAKERARTKSGTPKNRVVTI